MGKIVDITGRRFGRLVVIGDSGERRQRKVLWKCRCDCGGECLAIGYQLKNGTVQSCKCLQNERRIQTGLRNGTDKTLVFNGKNNKNNRSGHKGVYWNSQKQMWEAAIKIDYKKYHLCFSSDITECVRARKKAEEAVRKGEMPSLGSLPTTQKQPG